MPIRCVFGVFLFVFESIKKQARAILSVGDTHATASHEMEQFQWNLVVNGQDL